MRWTIQQSRVLSSELTHIKYWRACALHARNAIQQMARSRDSTALGCCGSYFWSFDLGACAWLLSSSKQRLYPRRKNQTDVHSVISALIAGGGLQFWFGYFANARFSAYGSQGSKRTSQKLFAFSQNVWAWPRLLWMYHVVALWAWLSRVLGWRNLACHFDCCDLSRPPVVIKCAPTGRSSMARPNNSFGRERREHVS
jgi:hypothetical protein